MLKSSVSETMSFHYSGIWSSPRSFSLSWFHEYSVNFSGSDGIICWPLGLYIWNKLHWFFFFTGKGKVEGLNDILHAYQQAYGDLFRFRIASRWIVVVSNPDLAKEVLSIRVKYPFRPEVEIVKMFGIRNNKEEGLGTLYEHFSKPVYT